MTVSDYFGQHYSLNGTVTNFLNTAVKVKEYLKGELIFEPDQFLKHIYFIESGFTRVYYPKAGKEITHYFFGQQTFCTGVESVFYQKPSLFGFQALMPSRVARIPFFQFKELANNHPVVHQIVEKVLLDNLIAFSKRLYHNQFETAAEKYQALLQENPELLQNASLGHIASYLGVSQQTLSVIRGAK